MKQMQVKVKKVLPDAIIPEYATEGSVAFDLVAAKDVIIPPKETRKVPTGLAFEIPVGYEMQIRMRSGIAYRTDLRLPNGVGTIDSDYRGQVYMLFENTWEWNLDREHKLFTLDGEMIETDIAFPVGTYIVRKGERIAQGIIAPVVKPQLVEVEELSETARGDGGFGSTGIREGRG